ncbi:MAG TPA: glycosyltransferase [Thermoanaerobaculia bacterium]|nr:glycosyltransferase [Thermoanaerobaculia bacterium]
MTPLAEPGPPILVTGMHRSGTSLAASCLAAMGVDMGSRLLPADAANPRGYFEDVDFLEIDRRLVREATTAGEAGHPDWGWTESEKLDSGRWEAGREAARALIATRAGTSRWGWKDPRATLLLDFWDDLLGDARYLLLYRFPWEVADSMQRLGAGVFLDHPDYAYRIWTFYNRQLLDFHRRHRQRSLLVSADTLVNRLDDFASLVADRFALSDGHATLERTIPTTGQIGTLLGRDLFQQVGGADPLIGLVAAAHPECAALLAELDAAADLSASGLWSAPSPSGARLDGRDRERPVDLSIVIPCHDDGEFLLEAVASAERSVPEAAELIVVNDGSREPRTLEILSILRRAGYHVVDQENAGLAAARNRGIREARGRYLLPLDADNHLRPGFPAAALRILDEDPSVGVVYGSRSEFGLRSEEVEVPEFNLDELLRANYIDACAVFRREVWSACGGFDGGMPAAGWEDWDLWIGAAERGWRFHRLPGITFDYRVRPGSMATTLLRAEVGEPLRIYMFDKHHDLYRRRLPSLLTEQHQADMARATLAKVMTEREEGLRSERDRLAAELHRMSVESAPLVRERDQLAEERQRLYTELASWRRRVAFMEGTRAWRLRNVLLRLRGRLSS